MVRCTSLWWDVVVSGSGMAVRLTDQGHSVAILDKNPRAFRRLPRSWPGMRVVGSGFDRDALDTAGADAGGCSRGSHEWRQLEHPDRADCHETYEVPRVVARIYDPAPRGDLPTPGDTTVATVTWTIDRVLQRMLPEAVAAEWMDATGHLMLLGTAVPDDWAGGKIRKWSREQAEGSSRSPGPASHVSTSTDCSGKKETSFISQSKFEAMDELVNLSSDRNRRALVKGRTTR